MRDGDSTMATLTVWKFPTTRGAAEAEETLRAIREGEADRAERQG